MEKMTINDLLTVQDLINLGNADNKQVFTRFTLENLEKYACKNNPDRKEFALRYKKYILDEFDKLGQPTSLYDNAKALDIPMEKYEDLCFSLLIKKDENGKYYSSYSKHDFFSELYAEHLFCLKDYLVKDEEAMKEFADSLEESSDNIEELLESLISSDGTRFKMMLVDTLKENFLVSIKDLDGDDFKDAVLEGLKKIKNYYVRFIKKIESCIVEDSAFFINKNSESRLSNDDAVAMYKGNRSVINWYRNNIDKVIEFLNGEYPHEVIDVLDKDMFVLLNCMSVEKNLVDKLITCKLDTINLDEYDHELLKDAANYMNNYLLLVKYIKDEHDSSYNEYLVLKGDNSELNTINNEVITRAISQLCDKCIGEDELEYSDPEELLKAIAPDTWRKLKNKKIAKDITITFEMIAPGKKDTYSIDRSCSRVYSKSKIRQEQIEEDYRKLEDKLDYYKQKDSDNQIALNLFGINNFIGYFAKFMKNGCVVLDKYYTYGKDRRGKEKKMPAHSEGIYIMNYEDFADLCRYNKQELIEEVRNNNPNIIRKGHSKNWRKNLDEIIEGPGYGGIDYDLLDDIVRGLGGKSI